MIEKLANFIFISFVCIFIFGSGAAVGGGIEQAMQKAQQEEKKNEYAEVVVQRSHNEKHTDTFIIDLGQVKEPNVIQVKENRVLLVNKENGNTVIYNEDRWYNVEVNRYTKAEKE